MNTTTRSSVNTRSATTATIQGTQHLISEIFPMRILIRIRMKKFKNQKVKKIQQVEQIRDKKSQEVNEKFLHNHGRENR